MPAFGTITPSQLSRLIGTPDAPAIIDVRDEGDFAADPRLLPGAHRSAHGAVAALAPELSGRAAVVLCQRGRKLSEGAAALLRSHGIAAEVLEGGWFAAIAAGLPAIPARLLPHDGTASLWVTRARPKIDRIACPWLIRRFIDEEPRFLWLADPTRAPRGALGFDYEGARFTHVGAKVTFEVMVLSFGLERDAALARVAGMVHFLDVGGIPVPEAAGVEAVLAGLQVLHADDDALAAAAGPVFDALYAAAGAGKAPEVRAGKAAASPMAKGATP